MAKMPTRREPAHLAPLLTPADDAVLCAVHDFSLLTSVQVCKLLYTYPGSLAYAQKRLKRLADANYLQMVYLPKLSRAGSSPSLYGLTRRGQRHLAELGVAIPGRARPSRVREYTHLFLHHLKASNDIMIAARMLARASPHIAIARQLTEQQLKHQPASLDDGRGGRIAIIPDGYLDCHVTTTGGRYQACFAWEIDRATEHAPAWKHKVAGLVRFANGPYQAQFDTDVLTVCVVAVPTKTMPVQQRLRQLATWTEEQLDDLGERATADLFRFAAFDPEAEAPAAIFFAKRWAVPHRAGLVALLPGPAAGREEYRR